MTQKVITLVWYKDLWRLKTPSGNLLDAHFKGTLTDAADWARLFVSSWSNVSINIQEITNEEARRISQQTVRFAEMS